MADKKETTQQVEVVEVPIKTELAIKLPDGQVIHEHEAFAALAYIIAKLESIERRIS